jgi:hypothetical protein
MSGDCVSGWILIFEFCGDEMFDRIALHCFCLACNGNTNRMDNLQSRLVLGIRTALNVREHT